VDVRSKSPNKNIICLSNIQAQNTKYTTNKHTIPPQNQKKAQKKPKNNNSMFTVVVRGGGLTLTQGGDKKKGCRKRKFYIK